MRTVYPRGQNKKFDAKLTEEKKRYSKKAEGYSSRNIVNITTRTKIIARDM